MNRVGFRDLIKEFTPDTNVYINKIPEDYGLPAIAYNNISDRKVNRSLDGEYTGSISTWRIKIVCKTLSECDALTTALDLMDGHKNVNFNLVQIINISDDPVGKLDKYFTTSIDVRTYEAR